MSFYLLHNDGRSLLATDTPVVRARDRAPIAEAGGLLARLGELHRDQEARAATAEAEARDRGYTAGFAAGEAAFVEAVAEIARQAAAHQSDGEDKIAELALAAVRQMLGAIGDEEAMAGVARRAVAAVVATGPILVETSPAMQARVEAALGEGSAEHPVSVAADAALSDRECRIHGPDGRIIADLDGQVAALAERWELDHVA
ncbi:FliH/SctL family protein [Sphingomonas sp. MMS12-HWE2-04]|uniref:FliH/SctL family protein n=1 Tax=Sphingomonas sp. MMS12-HWE2-04 TaxID=3234199 RepID=UPI00384E095A